MELFLARIARMDTVLSKSKLSLARFLRSLKRAEGAERGGVFFSLRLRGTAMKSRLDLRHYLAGFVCLVDLVGLV
jgi:hypothetical protein